MLFAKINFEPYDVKSEKMVANVKATEQRHNGVYVKQRLTATPIRTTATGHV